MRTLHKIAQSASILLRFTSINPANLNQSSMPPSGSPHVATLSAKNVWTHESTLVTLIFEATGDPIAQEDVNNVTQSLVPEYGERAAMMVVARLMAHQEREHARQKQTHKIEMDKMRTKEKQVKNDGFTLSDNDFYDSDEDMDFGEDEDEDDDYAEGEGEEEEK